MTDLDDALAAIEEGKPAPVYLISGEEFLVRRAAEAVVDKLVPSASRDLNVAVVDGAAGAREIAAHLDTLPMFRGRKVVLVEGAEFLGRKKDKSGALARAKELWQAGRQRDAARRLLAAARATGLAPEDLADKWEAARTALGLAPEDTWAREAARYAAEQGIAAPAEETELLVKALQNGPPGENVLVLTCAAFDAALPLVKLISRKGVVISREVERSGKGVQGLDYRGVVQEVLGPLGKRLSRDAEAALKARVGAQMRLLAGELTKLVAYAGERKTIEAADVELLVARVAEEDFFEMQNALGERDLGKVLRLIEDDFAHQRAALQILGRIAGAVRALLVVASRLQRIPAARGPRELSYDGFQDTVWPALSRQYEEAGEKLPHPFAAYMSYKRARRHSVAALARALCACAEADLALKGQGGGGARREWEWMVLESLARTIAGPGLAARPA